MISKKYFFKTNTFQKLFFQFQVENCFENIFIISILKKNTFFRK